MKNTTLAQTAKKIATDYKTLYVYGCFGAPMTAINKERYRNHTSYNKKPARTAMINAASTDTFGFDCVGLIKGILWGWNGGKTKTYGGATYKVNGVPDIGANAMINKCSDLSTDFSKIEVGEAVWISGHIGIYIGDGLVVESTPKWKNGVQITACNCDKVGYNRRNWTKHGKLPYVTYSQETTAINNTKKSVTEIAKEVIDGKWYTGAARKSALKKAGYDYDEVQAEVNKILKGGTSTSKKKSIVTIAKEIIAGKWYSGAARKSALKKAGYTDAEITAIQKKVNELL